MVCRVREDSEQQKPRSPEKPSARVARRGAPPKPIWQTNRRSAAWGLGWARRMANAWTPIRVTDVDLCINILSHIAPLFFLFFIFIFTFLMVVQRFYQITHLTKRLHG